MPDNRFTFRTHHSFATRSNKNRLVRTPGGRLSVQHVQKKTARHTCGDTGAKLNGIPAISSSKFKALSKNKKTVARAYGGVLSAGAVRTRIIRAFLVEEKKMVKKVQKAQVRVCLHAADPQSDLLIVHFSL
jgi:large subunit ribosomal protein L34e